MSRWMSFIWSQCLNKCHCECHLFEGIVIKNDNEYQDALFIQVAKNNKSKSNVKDVKTPRKRNWDVDVLTYTIGKNNLTVV